MAEQLLTSATFIKSDSNAASIMALVQFELDVTSYSSSGCATGTGYAEIQLRLYKGAALQQTRNVTSRITSVSSSDGRYSFSAAFNVTAADTYHVKLYLTGFASCSTFGQTQTTNVTAGFINTFFQAYLVKR